MAEILFVRLGAFGDILHALPAAASLRRTMPEARLTWAVEPKWAWLLAGNPDVDAVLPVNRRSWTSVRAAWAFLRERRFDLAVDVQGLLKSALIARASGAPERWGFAAAAVREPLSARLTNRHVNPAAAHVVDQNLQLARAAGALADVVDFPLPDGVAEGELPDRPFVLACPQAGWVAKQWPMEHYRELARMLLEETGHAFVLNVGGSVELPEVAPAHLHRSGLPGLLHATRRASAVLGLDSGPLHLAAALSKPGVALFGPTDPGRNGPYSGTIRVLRDAAAPTTYQRIPEILPCMRALSPRMVFEQLIPCLSTASPNPTPTR